MKTSIVVKFSLWKSHIEQAKRLYWSWW